MDGIRDLVLQIQADEHNNLNEHQRQSNRTYQIALSTGLATALLGLVMVGALVWVLNRSLRTRQQAAAVVHDQRQWLRTTLASIGDAVIATDTQGRVAFLNGVAETLTGWTQDEAKGQPLETVFQIVNEQSRNAVENPAARALREGKSSDWRTIPSSSPRTGPGGRSTTARTHPGRLGPRCRQRPDNFHDITERRRWKRNSGCKPKSWPRPTRGRTNSWRCWPTNCATPWPRSGTPCKSCGSPGATANLR